MTIGSERNNFRIGEMLEYRPVGHDRKYYVMVKEVIADEGVIGGLYKCFAISPGLELVEGVSDFLPGKSLTRFL